MNTSSLTWGEIDRQTQALAQRILDYTSGDIATWEYHRTNAKFLNRWWSEKIRFYVQLESSVKGAEVTPEFTATADSLKTEKLKRLRETLTKNLRTFDEILNSFELWDKVLRSEVWLHFENGGTIDDLPLDATEKYHQEYQERQNKRHEKAWQTLGNTLPPKKQKM